MLLYDIIEGWLYENQHKHYDWYVTNLWPYPHSRALVYGVLPMKYCCFIRDESVWVNEVYVLRRVFGRELIIEASDPKFFERLDNTMRRVEKVINKVYKHDA